MRKLARHVTALVVVLVGVVVAACSTDDGLPGNASPPPDAEVTVVAEHFSFDTDEIRLTAGEAALLYFVNRDDEGHNITIYPLDGGDDALFRGEVVADGSAVYRIPAIEAGTYRFQCDPHPVMNGTLVVEEATG